MVSQLLDANGFPTGSFPLFEEDTTNRITANPQTSTNPLAGPGFVEISCDNFIHYQVAPDGQGSVSTDSPTSVPTSPAVVRYNDNDRVYVLASGTTAPLTVSIRIYPDKTGTKRVRDVDGGFRPRLMLDSNGIPTGAFVPDDSGNVPTFLVSGTNVQVPMDVAGPSSWFAITLFLVATGTNAGVHVSRNSAADQFDPILAAGRTELVRLDPGDTLNFVKVATGSDCLVFINRAGQ